MQDAQRKRRANEEAWREEHRAMWAAVRRRPELSGEDKLAWLFLSEISRAGRDLKPLEYLSPKDVAEYQGVDSGKGPKRLLSLAAKGFLRIVDRPEKKKRGLWNVRLMDPPEIAAIRKAIVDRQALLFDDVAELGDEECLGERGEATTIEAAVEPQPETGAKRTLDGAVVSVAFPGAHDAEPAGPHAARQAPSPSVDGTVDGTVDGPSGGTYDLENASAHPHLRLSNLSGSNLSPAAAPSTEPSTEPSAPLSPEMAALVAQLDRRREAAAREHGGLVVRRATKDAVQAEPRHVGDATAALANEAARRSSPEEQRREADRYIAEILRAAPGVYRGRAAYFAWAIVFGHVSPKEHYEVLANLKRARDSHELRASPAHYVNAAWSKILIDRGFHALKPKQGDPYAKRK